MTELGKCSCHPWEFQRGMPVETCPTCTGVRPVRGGASTGPGRVWVLTARFRVLSLAPVVVAFRSLPDLESVRESWALAVPTPTYAFPDWPTLLLALSRDDLEAVEASARRNLERAGQWLQRMLERAEVPAYVELNSPTCVVSLHLLEVPAT